MRAAWQEGTKLGEYGRRETQVFLAAAPSDTASLAALSSRAVLLEPGRGRADRSSCVGKDIRVKMFASVCMFTCIFSHVIRVRKHVLTCKDKLHVKQAEVVGLF